MKNSCTVFHRNTLIKFLPIIVFGFFATSAVHGQSAAINNPGLNETDLDGQSVTITLTDETFVDLTLAPGNFSLNNAPGGLTIESFTGVTSTTAVVNLAFTPGDFDASIANFSISIDQSELTVTSAGVLTTNTIIISADIESASLSDPGLNERDLDAQSVTITLINETFADLSLDQSNFDLNNFPAGLTIQSIGSITPTTAVVNFAFTPGDFDTDIPNFSISIDQSELTQTSSGVLTTNAITITAYVENPVANLSSNPAPLFESTLNGSLLMIALTDESFTNPGGLVPGNFIPVSAPPGLTISSISGTPTATNVTLVIAFNGTDFDVTYPDFHLLINNAVLNQSTTDLATSSLSIGYALEPVITSVSIPNDTMHIGSVVTATITVQDDQGAAYSLEGASNIGGYTLTNLVRQNNTTYTCTFTVTENGNSYAAAENIPLQIQLFNGSLPGNVYTASIVQANDLLDASRPEFDYIYTTDGAMSIGSEIFFVIQTDGSGYSFTPTSHVNSVPVSSPSIEITQNGPVRYLLRYMVQEDDNNVSTGALTMNMVAVDPAGNESFPFTQVDADYLSIDASRPEIYQAYVSSTDDNIIVGETLEITVLADQSGYRNHASSWINNVPVGPYVTFTDLGNNLYRYAYTVQEQDGSVEAGNLAINIVLQDANPYINTNSPAWTDLEDNNVSIHTDRPSATVSGSTDICAGDSARVSVLLGGTPPWQMTFSNGSTTFQRTSSVTNYSEWFHPVSTTSYSVVSVTDGTGNSSAGAGVATITVHPLPVVQILNLQPVYDVKTPPVVLQYTPLGGFFTGRGITESPWTFNPAIADTTLSPHQIEYVYTDVNSCMNSDIRIVSVVSKSAFITFEKEFACFNDSTFLITGWNMADVNGTFTVQPDPPPGAFEDLGNDTAILRPEVYALDADQVVKIIYTFTDSVGTKIPIDEDLTIDYLMDAQIDFIADKNLCQNDALIELSGNYEGGHSFRGPGVVSTDSGYYFNPRRAILGQNAVVYEYVAPSQCRVSDTVVLNVADAPEAEFRIVDPCIPAEGGTVQFENRSDTGTTWLWNFGDPMSLGNNESSLKNPTHHYDTGSWTITLDVYLGACRDQERKTLDINAKPKAEFTMSSNCKTDGPIIMNGQETVYPPDIASVWTWKIDDEGTEIIRSDTSGQQFSYVFPAVGAYGILYKVETANGCSDSIYSTVSLSKTHLVSPDSPYSEDFELTGHGWIKMSNTTQNSWTDDVVTSGEFPKTASSGIRAWYTDLPDPATQENSWVLSPCFNFENLDRPMVSLYIKRSLDRNRNGAALQYTIDNGLTWHNVGDEDDGGRNWYNSTSIIPDVGDNNNNTGWTGALLPTQDDYLWQEAAHAMDELIGKPEVRFRVAFGTLADARTGTNEGFAFDKFTIRQRSRVSVLEYFTNANTSDCVETDTMIMEIMNEVAADVIDIQYHAMGSMPDKFYNENSVPANSRGTIYGVTGIPYAILDGGIYNEEREYSTTYDFNTRDPNVEDIRLRSLMDPDFKLTVLVSEYSPQLKLSIEIEALRNLNRKERTLYALVLQRKVVDQTYWGTNGMTVFRHAARKMVPDAGGTYLGNKSWTKGETVTPSPTWDSPSFPLFRDSITIAVFIQDDETNEILQAATNPEYVVSTFDGLEPPSQVLIYPNPARELVNVYLEKSPGEEMRFTLYDLSGKIVITDVIEPWQQLFTRSLGDLEQGMYIVEIRSRDRRQVIYRDKLLHY